MNLQREESTTNLSLNVGGIEMIENKLLYVFSRKMLLGFHLNLVDLYLHLLRLHLLYRTRCSRIRDRLLAATATATCTAAAFATPWTTRHRLLRRDHFSKRLHLTIRRTLFPIFSQITTPPTTKSNKILDISPQHPLYYYSYLSRSFDRTAITSKQIQQLSTVSSNGSDVSCDSK